MNDLIVKEVEFNGEKLIGIYKEGKIYIPLKKSCEFLGVNFNGQHQRIRRDETLIKGVCKIHIPSEGGIQETLTLEISFLPLWLTGIKAQQCKEEIRENLIEFKLKAKDALADAFFGKRVLPNKDEIDFKEFDYENKLSLIKNILNQMKLDLVYEKTKLEVKINTLSKTGLTDNMKGYVIDGKIKVIQDFD